MTDFITIWQTTADGESITLPLVNGGTYNFVADWGDLGPTSEITAWDDADKTHAYAVAGTYTVTITGVITGWAFNNAGDKLKCKEVIQWGSLAFGAGALSAGAFYGCAALTVSAVDAPDFTGTTSLYQFFRSCASLTTIWNANWALPSVTYLYASLFGATSYNQAFPTGLFPNGNDFSYFLCNATSYNQAFPAGLFPKGITFDNFLTATAYNQVFPADLFPLGTNFTHFLFNADSYNQVFPAGLFPNGTNFSYFLSNATYNQVFPAGLFPNGTNFGYFLSNATIYNQVFPAGLFPNGTNFDNFLSVATAYNLAFPPNLFPASTNFTSFLQSVTINKQYYSALLLDLYRYAKTGLTFHGGGSKYYRGWPTWIRAGFVAQGNTITADGGQEGVISSGMAMMGHC